MLTLPVTERVLAIVAAHQVQPFAWGRYDCATLWGAVAQAITGRSPFAMLPPWQDQRGALRALRAAGVADVETFLAQNFVAIAPESARFGDLVMPDLTPSPLLSPAVVLTGDAFTRSVAAFVTVPRALWRSAYRIA